MTENPNNNPNNLKKTSFIDFMSNRYQDLTQGVKGLIQTATDAFSKKPQILEDKFVCPVHPTKFVKFFSSNPDERKPYLLCEDCVFSGAESEKSSPTDIGPGHVKSRQIGDLYDHFMGAYDEIRDHYERKNINKIMLENFLDKIPDMQHQMSRNIEDEKQKFAGAIEKVVELFTLEMKSIKEHIYSLLNSEMETFNSNLEHTQKHVHSFLDKLKTFEEIPQNEDIHTKINKLRNSEELVTFIKENAVSVNVLSMQLDDFSAQSSENYRYAQYLMRKTYKNLQKPPKNPAISTFTITNTELESPIKFLKQVVENIVEQELPSNLKLENVIPNFPQECSLESFTRNPRKTENYEIDALDFFYPSTPKGLQCLHYYDPDKRYLMMVSLDELVQSLVNNKDLNPGNIIYKIHIPKDLVIPRYAKTLSLPDGSVYFIGGENTSETIVFECKGLVSKARKTSYEDPKDAKISQTATSFLNFSKKKEAAKIEEMHITTQGNFFHRAKMSRPKYGHGLVYIGNGSIYSIAGYDTSCEEYTAKCERFIVKEDRWVEIKDCLNAVSHPGVCTFDNRYIYKFGGFMNEEGEMLDSIERYHIERDIWTEIKVAQNSGAIDIYSKSFAMQINDQEIMVLGGTGQEFLFSADCAFKKVNKSEDSNNRAPLRLLIDDGILEYNKQQSATVEEEIEKPSELMMPLDNRLVNQSLIYDGKLYCLAVGARVDEVVKNVMIFDGKSWTVVL